MEASRPTARSAKRTSARDLTGLVRKVRPAIGTVMTPTGSGSGFAVKLTPAQRRRVGDAVIVTNAHVVEGSESITFHFADGFDLGAEPLLVDRVADVAFLKVDEKPRTTLPIRTENPEVAEGVFAVGTPYGFECSVSAGIVSGIERNLTGASPATVMGDLIQTDAVITSGNSGGPLIDLSCRVVGINTISHNPTKGVRPDLHFAVPGAVIDSHLRELVEFGDGVVKRASIGAALQHHTFEPDEQRRWKRRTAVRVDRISDPDGPAATGKLEAGDVIIRFRDVEVDHYHDLQIALNRWAIGKKCPIDVVREGKRVKLTVVPREKT